MTKILGICGSLRKASFNHATLEAASKLLPAGASLEIVDLHDIPLFNQDQEKTPPPPVVDLKNKIRAADGILFATPEYNYSVPGVLKNAIDWASRPSGDSAWKRKPAAILGASTGVVGSARAQQHLRQILVGLDMPTVTQPEVLVGSAAQKFNEQRELTDEAAKDFIRKLLANLVTLIERHRDS